MFTPKLHGVRMWVTEGCNAFCPFCMNARERTNAQMDLKKFYQLCQYFAQNSFDKIAIMGGEPTIHPDFIHIMHTAQHYFRYVYLFTNALEKETLMQYTPRKEDVIIYNFHYSYALDEQNLLLDRLGERILDIVIDDYTDIEKTINEIFRVATYDKNNLKIRLVINSSCNIFKQKEFIVKNVNEIYDRIKRDKDIHISFECNAPLCFTVGSSLPPFQQNTFCHSNSVLIDSSYNVRFCNLFTTPLINMFQEDKIIPLTILSNYVEMSYLRLRLNCLDKICKDCLLYNVQCNGKCHIGQDIIKREDIVKTTKLPWLRNI